MPPPEAIHLKPAAPLADRVLLPGDPHRALAVAQGLLAAPRMFNHHRGLWGYTGEAPDGRALTVQATGMGGPSAAVVVQELLDLGASTLVRVGTCGALVPELALEELIVATAVVPADGASAALGARDLVAPDQRLTAALIEAARRSGDARPAVVVSTDLFYDERAEALRSWRAHGAQAVEMEAAVVLRLAEREGAAAACMLAVSDILAGPGFGTARRRIDRAALDEAGMRLGKVALDALASLPVT